MIPRQLGMQRNAAMYSNANVWMQTFDCCCTYRVAQSSQPNVLGKIRERLCSHVNLNFCRQLPASKFAKWCACQA